MLATKHGHNQSDWEIKAALGTARSLSVAHNEYATRHTQSTLKGQTDRTNKSFVPSHSISPNSVRLGFLFSQPDESFGFRATSPIHKIAAWTGQCSDSSQPNVSKSCLCRQDPSNPHNPLQSPWKGPRRTRQTTQRNVPCPVQRCRSSLARHGA